MQTQQIHSTLDPLHRSTLFTAHARYRLEQDYAHPNCYDMLQSIIPKSCEKRGQGSQEINSIIDIAICILSSCFVVIVWSVNLNIAPGGHPKPLHTPTVSSGEVPIPVTTCARACSGLVFLGSLPSGPLFRLWLLGRLAILRSLRGIRTFALSLPAFCHEDFIHVLGRHDFHTPWPATCILSWTLRFNFYAVI